MSSLSTPSVPGESAPPKRTPLYEAHRLLGAKMVDFSGWSMPLQYSGIIDEHRATRAAIGLFDVCHMGEAVQRLVTNDVARLADGRAFYTVACLPSGGIVDDLIVYRVAGDHFLIVVNASNVDKDRDWFVRQSGALCDVVDVSAETALLAFQGPRAAGALQPLTPTPLEAVSSFGFVADTRVAGVKASLARTGYTAEDGFEIFCAAGDAVTVWDRLLEAAVAVGGKPVGLGARDTLRLEGRLALYGNDLDETTTPLEAGLAWVVKLDGADFIGRAALRAQREAGVSRKLAGFVMTGRGIARHGYPIFDGEGNQIGQVTSGGPAPTLEKNIAMGYVPLRLDQPGTRVTIDCRGKRVEAEVVKGPFYKRDKRGG